MLDRLRPTNREALNRHHPDLWRWLQEYLEANPEPSFTLRIGAAPGGTAVRMVPLDPATFHRGNDGWLHGPSHALGESKKQIDSIDWKKTSTVILFGSGLGITAQLLYRAFWRANHSGDRPRKIIVFEPEPHLFLEALARENWEKLLSDTNVWFAIGTPFHQFFEHPDFVNFPLSIWDQEISVVAGTELSYEEEKLRQKIQLTFIERAEESRKKITSTIERVTVATRHREIRTLLLLSPLYPDFQRRLIKGFSENGVNAHLIAYDETSLSWYRPWIWLEYVREFKPDGILLVNHTSRSLLGHDALNRINLPIVSWFLENPQRSPLYPKLHRSVTDSFIAQGGPCGEREVICCYDRAYLSWLRLQGFQRTFHQPLGTGFDPFFAQGCPATHGRVVYVNSKLAEPDEEELAALKSEAPELLQRIDRLGELREQENSTPIAELISRVSPFIHESITSNASTIRLVEDLVTRAVRLKYLHAVKPFGLEIYGPPAWAQKSLTGDLSDHYRKELDPILEVPGLYTDSDITLNINHAQTCLGIPSRVFDIAACGGFVLSNRREAIADCFEPDREIACFDDEEEMIDKIGYYLKHSHEREQMTERAWERIQNNWTFKHTLTNILAFMRSS